MLVVIAIVAAAYAVLSLALILGLCRAAARGDGTSPKRDVDASNTRETVPTAWACPTSVSLSHSPAVWRP
jgi:hypothetical protein